MTDAQIRRRKNVLDRWVALGIGVVAAAVYAATMSRGVFPGPSAEMLAAGTGIEPLLSPMNPLWNLLMRAAAVAGTVGGLVRRIHLMHVGFGVLALSLLYRCVSWLIFRAVDWDDRTWRRARQAAVVGGVMAVLAVGGSIPFWIASTRSYFQVFDVLLLTVVARMLMLLDDTGKKRYAMVFAFVYGLGLAETALFWLMAPLFLLGLLLILWRQGHLSVRLLLPMTLVGALGCCLFFVSAIRFYESEGFHLAGYGGFLQIIRIMLQNHIRTVRGSLPRVGWLILVFLSVAPWLTALLVARRALNDERDWSYYVLHMVMAFIAVLVILDVEVSPWQLLGLGAMPVMPYVLNGMLTGYLAGYAWLVAADWWPNPSAGRFRHGISRFLGPVLVVALLGVVCTAAWRNRTQTDGRQTDFITRYADQVIDSLEGRTWLVTDGSIDMALLCRAHERGVALNLLNLAKHRDPIYIKRMQGWFESPRLRNSAELGVLPLVQDWLQMDPEIERKVAIFGAPDLWAGLDRLVLLPNQTLFLATRDGSQVDPESRQAAHQVFWETVEPLLFPRDRPELGLSRTFRRHLRRHTGFVANNFGVWLQDRGLHDAGVDAYRQARQIDPRNVSAMLNLIIAVQAGYRPELRESVESEAEGFFEGITQQPHIWSLSRYYGYVRDPMAFARLGQSWALSGQPGIAVSGLKRAIELLPAERRDRARETLADVYLLREDDERGEALYWELLVENPENERALLTLARIATRRGDFEQAQTLLERARDAQVNPTRLAMEWASYYLASGQDGRARLALEELVDVEPDDLRAWAMLSAVLVQQNEIDRLESVVRQMERLAGPEDYLVLISKAQMAFRRREWERAREFFRRAVRQRPGVPLDQEWVLRMDFLLADKESGEQTARALLRIDRENAFANYVMGSLLLERGRIEAAEDHLRTSVAARRTPEALNDLAVLLQQMGDYDEAELHARAACQMNERMYAAWDTLGLILMRKGQLDEAREAFENALSMTQDDLRVHLHMAQLKQKLGERQRAREIVDMLEMRRSELPRREQQELSELAQQLLRQ